jgi:hypothetical protein
MPEYECSQCGSDVKENDKICPKCGASLDETTQQNVEPTTDASTNNNVIEKTEAKEKLTLENQLNSGANWFFWIAGLSLVNYFLTLMGSKTVFIVGLGITQVVEGITSEGQSNLKIISFLLDVSIAGIFVAFGYFAKKGFSWCFTTGMILYTLDGLIFLIEPDFLSIGFHLFALYNIYRGLKANKLLSKMEDQYTNIISQPSEIIVSPVAWVISLVVVSLSLIGYIIYSVVFVQMSDYGIGRGELDQETSQTLTYYYQQPNPTILPELMRKIEKSGLKEEGAYPIVGFFTAIFSKDIFSDADISRIINDFDSTKYIFEYCSNLSKTKDTILHWSEQSPHVNDLIWGAYFATGDKRYIQKLISQVELLKQLDSVHLFLTGYTAKWSLCSIALQHPSVKRIIEEEIKIAAPELEQELADILNFEPDEIVEQAMEMFKSHNDSLQNR